MKTVYIVLGSVIVLFIVAQFFIHRSSTKIEYYPYTVTSVFDGIEIRDYQARLFTTVAIENQGYKKNASNGFSKLGGYIFGANARKQKIAMTSPVSMTLGAQPTMGFMVPKGIRKDDLPKPNLADITFKQEPKKTMAVITFSGWANDATIKEHKYGLIAILKANGIKHSDQFYCFGYNPPYDLFFRRNEIAVVL
ncbi:heme-binding protein [Flavobacteriaceae bacterium]|nr:heme-binding protein [Flavobacteriaceae bacterium]